MILPKHKGIYSYKGKEYIVIYIVWFDYVYVQEVIKGNTNYNAQFSSINWWKFVFNAKYLRSAKLDSNY